MKKQAWNQLVYFIPGMREGIKERKQEGKKGGKRQEQNMSERTSLHLCTLSCRLPEQPVSGIVRTNRLSFIDIPASKHTFSTLDIIPAVPFTCASTRSPIFKNPHQNRTHQLQTDHLDRVNNPDPNLR